MSPEERQHILPVVQRALDRGYTISVYDGGDYPLKRSSNLDDILNALGATDEEWIIIRDPRLTPRNLIGTIQLVYGNDPDEVVADYSDNLVVEEIVEGPSED